MLNYIIATYAATKWEYTLHLQLQTLYALVMKGETKYISQVTIVCPKVKQGHLEQPFYYQKDLWSELFAKTNVKLVYLDYVGNNKDASYDQWIQAYLAYPDFEYFIFIEDDYTIHPSLTNFDSMLVNYYNASVEEYDGIGYVCTLAARMNRMNHHSAISNGIVNKKTMQTLGEDVLDEFYRFATLHYCQSAFSLLFQYKGVHILSMHRDFAAWFWASAKNSLEIYSNKSVTNLFFVPMQYLLKYNFEVDYTPVDGDDAVEKPVVVEKKEEQVAVEKKEEPAAVETQVKEPIVVEMPVAVETQVNVEKEEEPVPPPKYDFRKIRRTRNKKNMI